MLFNDISKLYLRINITIFFLCSITVLTGHTSSQNSVVSQFSYSNGLIVAKFWCMSYLYHPGRCVVTCLSFVLQWTLRLFQFTHLSLLWHSIDFYLVVSIVIICRSVHVLMSALYRASVDACLTLVMLRLVNFKLDELVFYDSQGVDSLRICFGFDIKHFWRIKIIFVTVWNYKVFNNKIIHYCHLVGVSFSSRL